MKGLHPRGKIAPAKIGASTSVLLGCGTFLMALLLTGSIKSAVLWCGCCGAVICTADIILGTWTAWDKRQARRALDKHACGKPERAWMTDEERHAWLGIILKSYSNEELDSYTRRGEALRANRRQP